VATERAGPAEIRIGARVCTQDGVLGTVEWIEREPDDQTGQTGYLIVLAEVSSGATGCRSRSRAGSRAATAA
jgi:hypothetical protein